MAEESEKYITQDISFSKQPYRFVIVTWSRLGLQILICLSGDQMTR